MQQSFPVFLMLLLVLSFSGCITQSPESILEERRLRTAVRIHPEHEMGYLRLAQFLENQRRYAETLHVLKQGQQRVPDSLLMVRLEGLENVLVVLFFPPCCFPLFWGPRFWVRFSVSLSSLATRPRASKH